MSVAVMASTAPKTLFAFVFIFVHWIYRPLEAVPFRVSYLHTHHKECSRNKLDFFFIYYSNRGTEDRIVW